MKLERRPRQRLGFAPPRSPAPSCSTFFKLPDLQRADPIGSYYGNHAPDFERADRFGTFLGLPTEPRLRRAPDRLRRGSGPQGGGGRDAAGNGSK
jgi:hypothetical protein